LSYSLIVLIYYNEAVAFLIPITTHLVTLVSVTHRCHSWHTFMYIVTRR